MIRSAIAILSAATLTATPAPNQQWHISFLRIPQALQISTGSGVTVAVIDTGVEPHPDLAENILDGTSFLEKDNSKGKKDEQGHGTAMAGIIAAHGEGKSGLQGIAPDSKILPVRINESAQLASTEHAAEAIAWAVQSGANIINISMGGGPNSATRKAIENAASHNVIIVASSGNRPQDSIIPFPGYIDGVVAVGATDDQGYVSPLSVSGEKLALTAPGTEIVSTGLHGTSRKGSGTSDSAAIVSGVAALVWSRYPELSAAEVVHRMTATAVDKGAPGRDPEYGFGIVDPVAALTADVPPLNATAVPTPAGESAPALPETNPPGRVAVIVVAVVASLLGVALVVALFVFRLRAGKTRKIGQPRKIRERREAPKSGDG